MAKQTWVKDNGQWRKVKSAWVNVGGAWKKDVMPKGVVSGGYKEFMSYYEPQIYAASGIIGESPRLIKYDKSLNEIYNVNLGTRTSPVTTSSKNAVAISDDETYLTVFAYRGAGGNIYKIRAATGEVISETFLGFNPGNPMFEPYRVGDYIGTSRDDYMSLSTYRMSTNTQYGYTAKSNDIYVTGVAASSRQVFYISQRSSSDDRLYLGIATWSSGIYTYIISTSVTPNGTAIQVFHVRDNVLYLILADTNNNYSLQTRSTSNLNTIIRTVSLGVRVGQVLYDNVNDEVVLYSDNAKKILFYRGSDLTKVSEVNIPLSGMSYLYSLDEVGNLYTTERNSASKSDLIILDRTGKILATRQNAFNTSSPWGSMNLTASRYKSRYQSI